MMPVMILAMVMMPMVINDEGPENDGIQCLIQCLVVLFSWSLVFLLSCCLARKVVRLLHKGFLAMSNLVSNLNAKADNNRMK